MRSLLGALAALGLALPSLAHAEATRVAAQRGLDFLGQNTVAWQKSNNCYGCHVQAVTLEGLAVGHSHHYDVPTSVIGEVLRGMMKLPGGSRTPEGLSHPGFPKTAKTFGAAAFARYDELVDPQVREDLIKLAHELVAMQGADGAVHGDHQSYPVTEGVMQSTFQATQAWREAYARTADDAWLAPLRSAEGFLATTARSWEGKVDGVYLQDVNYAVMGLLASGVAPSEPSVDRLLKALRHRQFSDGGWGFNGASDAYATGQTVYTLRLAGLSETDPAVAKGLGWLVEHQASNGGWGAAGSARAEAMWGVLGLVSVDVLSVTVKGVSDGEHVTAKPQVTIEARDNQGSAVKQVELRIDDVVVKKADGGKLDYAWTTDGLKEGLHTVDAVATNAKGQTTRRRLEVYAGNVFLTQLGTRFTDGGTQITLRDIAPEGRTGTVAVTVFGDEGKEHAQVFEQTVPSAHGPLAFFFNGKAKDGKPLASGRYRAEVRFLDDAGHPLQSAETVFVQDSPEAQQARYAEVAGKLALDRDGAEAANAEVELVDDKGQVVQRAHSNEAGQYRFKGVSSGKYKVRFAKEGFAAPAVSVDAAAGAPAAKADSSFH
jgi:squalene-hopene/tetraprenyl-beta-curcumene cyclase